MMHLDQLTFIEDYFNVPIYKNDVGLFIAKFPLRYIATIPVNSEFVTDTHLEGIKQKIIKSMDKQRKH